MISLYTIGHSNQPIHRFIDLLQMHSIELLVDVRSTPYSRFHPQFNQKALQQSLQEAGIHYEYAGEALGGRPKDTSCYPPDQMVPTGQKPRPDPDLIYTKSWFLAGLQHLMETAVTQRTAILCSEGDPTHCHRHWMIGRLLHSQGHTVLHILKDGQLIPEPMLP